MKVNECGIAAIWPRATKPPLGPGYDGHPKAAVQDVLSGSEAGANVVHLPLEVSAVERLSSLTVSSGRSPRVYREGSIVVGEGFRGPDGTVLGLDGDSARGGWQS